MQNKQYSNENNYNYWRENEAGRLDHWCLLCLVQQKSYVYKVMWIYLICQYVWKYFDVKIWHKLMTLLDGVPDSVVVILDGGFAEASLSQMVKGQVLKSRFWHFYYLSVSWFTKKCKSKKYKQRSLWKHHDVSCSFCTTDEIRVEILYSIGKIDFLVVLWQLVVFGSLSIVFFMIFEISFLKTTNNENIKNTPIFKDYKKTINNQKTTKKTTLAKRVYIQTFSLCYL